VQKYRNDIIASENIPIVSFNPQLFNKLQYTSAISPIIGKVQKITIN